MFHWRIRVDSRLVAAEVNYDGTGIRVISRAIGLPKQIALQTETQNRLRHSSIRKNDWDEVSTLRVDADGFVTDVRQ
jgi:hypothetical protein